MSFESLWSRYATIWSIRDAQSRETEMLACLSEQIRYADPHVTVSGRSAFSDYMASFQQAMPDCSFEIRSTKSHHGRSLATWRLVDVAGREVFDGVSFARHADDGRLEEISGFFTPPPANS